MRTVEDALHLAELRARTGLEPELAQRYESDPAAAAADFAAEAAGSGPQPVSFAVHDLKTLAEGQGPALWCVCIASEADPARQASA